MPPDGFCTTILNFLAPAAMPTTSWMVWGWVSRSAAPKHTLAPGPAVEALLC